MSSSEPATTSVSKKQSRTRRASLHFPVGRVARHLRTRGYARRLGDTAPVYLAAVMEYLTAELMELAGNQAVKSRRARITPRQMQVAVRTDYELADLFKDVSIAAGGSAVAQVSAADLVVPTAL
jgi:histone H2A